MLESSLSAFGKSGFVHGHIKHKHNHIQVKDLPYKFHPKRTRKSCQDTPRQACTSQGLNFECDGLMTLRLPKINHVYLKTLIYHIFILFRLM